MIPGSGDRAPKVRESGIVKQPVHEAQSPTLLPLGRPATHGALGMPPLQSHGLGPIEDAHQRRVAPAVQMIGEVAHQGLGRRAWGPSTRSRTGARRAAQVFAVPCSRADGASSCRGRASNCRRAASASWRPRSIASMMVRGRFGLSSRGTQRRCPGAHPGGQLAPRGGSSPCPSSYTRR